MPLVVFSKYFENFKSMSSSLTKDIKNRFELYLEQDIACIGKPTALGAHSFHSSYGDVRVVLVRPAPHPYHLPGNTHTL